MAVSQPATRIEASPSAGMGGRELWPFLPLLLIAGAELAAYLANPGVAFDRTWLLAPLSAIFMFGLPLLIAIFAARAYRDTGVAAVLAIGVGMLGYSIAGGVLPSLFLRIRDVDAQVAIHNWAVLFLSASCFAASPLTSLSTAPPLAEEARSRRAALTYGLVVAGISAIAGLTLSGAMPRFHNLATGFTPFRGAVLGASLALLLVTSAAWWLAYLRTRLAFTRWYALGLLLYAVGILGILIEAEPGDLVSWAGRAGQFIAAPYFLMAVLAAGRERGFAVELVQSAIPYRPLVESIADAVVGLGRDGRIAYWNRAAQQLFGYDGREAFGRDLFDVISANADGERIRRLAAGAQRGARLELGLADRHGRAFPAELTLHATAEPAEPISVWVIRDVTDRKHAEEELRRHREHLEERVQSRTAELAMANKELEGFSYSMSHVLAAPLRAIDGYSHLLMQDYGDKLDPEGRRRLEVIRANALEMNQVIDDTLEFLRLGRQRLRRQPTDMAALVSAILAERAPEIAARKLTIVQAPLPTIEADPEMIALVWKCLIDNAIKFTGQAAEGRIEIGAEAQPSEDVFFVRDNGVGFDMKYAAKLFGVFYRAHGSEFEGNGMGLAVVQRIVVKHGGRAWAEGAPGRGAAIFFALPKRPPA